MPRLLPVLAVALFAALSGCGGGPSISAGGATFVDPLMQRWAVEYDTRTGVFVDYTAKGSGYGIAQMTGKSVAFGCTDVPMSRPDLEAAWEAGGEVVHIPVAIGAVAVVFNLPGITDLKLDGPTLADLYLRKVTKWNDPALAELNPGVALPDLAIVPVFRAEDSGTTATFTEYLSKVSPAFREAVGVSKKPNWPAGGTGEQGSGGVCGHVKANPGSIGYAEYSFAKNSHVAVAALRNKAGAYRKPEPAAVTAAAAAAFAEKPATAPYNLHELAFSLTEADAAEAYPVVGVTYAIAFTDPPANQGGEHVAAFLTWAVTDGQAFAGELGYAPLPCDLQRRCVALIGKVQAK